MKKVLSIILSLMMIVSMVPISAFTAFADEGGTHNAHDFSGKCVDLEDGTHAYKCTGCDEWSEGVPHVFVDHICECGAVEVVSSSETIPFDPDNRVIDSDSLLGMSYRCETDLFIVTAYQSADDGMTGGNAVHHVTITAKDPGTVINSVEAVVAGWGEYYDRVGVTAGDKVETGPVDDNTVVTVENINAGTFSFQGGIEAVVFTDLTVYYTSTAYSCEHTFGDDYRNDGETHSRKCTKCGEFVGGEAHTFTKHECACGATETTKMTETLPFSGSAFNEDGYLYKGTNFTVSGTATDTLANGLTIGNGNKMTITANDPTLTIERIEAELVMGGRDYLFIEVSSGEKLEKGSVEAPSTIHVINVNASSFTFSGSAGKNACKLEDITVYYTDGKIAHVLSDECVDNGDGTHTYCCTKCDDYGVTEDHTFVNGVCVCCAEDPSEFVVSEDGVLIAYNGEGGDVVIPDDMGITAINNSVFATNETLTSVVIPDGVTHIGKEAFKDCVYLKSVTIPKGVTTILSKAFSGCESLTTVYIACGADAADVADMIDISTAEYIQFDHEFENGVCVNCGAKEGAEEIDYTELDEIFELLENVDEDDYTAEAWDYLCTLTNDCYDYLDMSNQTQDDIDWFCDELKLAIADKKPVHVHTPSTPVQGNVVNATCTTDGSYDEAIYCTGCHEILSNEKKTIPALGHSFTGDYVNNGDGTHSRQCIRCDECGTAEAHAYGDTGVCVCGDKAAVYSEYYLIEGHEPKADGTTGLFNVRTFFVNEKGEKVVLKDAYYEEDVVVTFEDWYLYTMIQYKDGCDGKLDIRFVSMLDENLDQYAEAGFVFTVEGEEAVTVRTTEAVNSYEADGKTYTIDEFSEEDDFFFLQKFIFASDVVDADLDVTVSAYVKLTDGTTLTGESLTFNLGEVAAQIK